MEHHGVLEHYIEWILLETEMGFQIQFLRPGNKLEATFKVNEKVVVASEYYNLHGLWKTEVQGNENASVSSFWNVEMLENVQ